MNLTLKTPSAFSLPAVIRSHGWIQLAPFENLDDDQAFAYTIQLATGRILRFEVHTQDGTITVSAPGELTSAEEDEIRKTVTWMLCMDANLADFYQAARDEPRLQKAIQNYSGRILRSASLFEDINKTILTTNTLWGATKTMTRKMVEHYGAAHPENPEWKAFPTPGALAKISVEELNANIRVGYRAPFLSRLAQQVDDGSLDLQALQTSSLSTAELRKEFLKINGIGPYAAANLLMLLGRYDFLTIDSWALKMVSLEWHEGAPIKPKDVENAFTRWGEYKGLAYWMWDWTNQA